MIYLRSFLAGLAALIVYLLVSVLVFYIRLNRSVPQPDSLSSDGSYIFNSQWIMLPIPLHAILIGALLVFVATCFWKYRRISARRAVGQ